MASGDAPASSSSPPPPPTTAPEAAAASSPTTSETNHHDPDNDDNDPTTTAAASFRLGVSPALRRLDGFVPTTHSSSSTAADPDPADVDGTAPGARRAQRETDDAEQARRRYLERMDPEAAAPAAASHTRDTAVSIEMLEMRLRRARARHTRRLVTLRVRYDQGKKYLDDTFPEELEGIIPNTLYHTRITALNAALSRFRSIRDASPRSRLLVSLASLSFSALLIGLGSSGQLPAILIAAVVVVYFFLLLCLLSGRFAPSPAGAVDEVIAGFNREDAAPPRRLFWMSCRDEVFGYAVTAVETPWEITVDRIEAGRGDGMDPPPPVGDGDDDEDALPKYEADPPAFVPPPPPQSLSRDPPPPPLQHAHADPDPPPPPEFLVAVGAGAPRRD